VSVNGPTPLNNFRPFAIGAGTTVTINDLTITGGLVDDRTQPGYGYGAGIQNYGTLTLNRSTVEGNTYKGSRGGGIYSAGTLTLNQSTVAGNSADSFPGFSTAGAGIYNDGGVVTIDRSTIANNRFASGAVSTAQGGGIYSKGNAAQLSLTNSTLSGNFRHAIYVDGGNVSLDSVTIKLNDWGLYVQNSATIPHVIDITNSVLNDNGSLPDGNCYFPNRGVSGRVLNDGGHNLVGYGNDTCGIVAGVNGNLDEADMLGPLADNGGPTLTHAPLVGSPVLDAGDTTLKVDQRGHPRPLGPAADIGAYEDVVCLGQTTFPVSTEVELRDAIGCFNAQTTVGTYTIQFVNAIALTESTSVIDNSNAGVELLIDGSALPPLQGLEGTARLGVDTRLLEVAAGTKVTVQQLHFELGYAADMGGSVLNRGDLSLRQITMRGSTAPDGGGIYNASTGTILVEDSTIWRSGDLDNQPLPERGVVFNEGTLIMRNTTISGNRATVNAGIWNNDTGTMTLDSVTVAENEGDNAGAVALVNRGSSEIINSIFADSINGADVSCTVAPTGGYNLTELQASGAECFTHGVNNDIVGEDPMLLPLGNNGGVGFTLTHALPDTSPAKDSGGTALSTDQRGHSRPSGVDDRGAFESTSQGTLTVKKQANPADGTDFDFQISGDNLGTPITFQLDQGDSDGVNESETFIIDVGQYTITEEDSGAMGPVLINCSDANGPIGSATGNAVDIDMPLHGDIECTFFNEVWYSVSATPIGSGTVSCSPDRVQKGQSSTCTALPDAGFRVLEWTGDCAAAGANTQCFLAKIRKDQSSTVVFEAIPPATYTVTANVVQGTGTVSCSPPSVTAGGASTCTAIPAPGYQVESWDGDCFSWGSNAECYLTKIKSDQVSTVSFTALPFGTFTAQVTVDGGNGSVTCQPTSVEFGGTIYCDASPDQGYRVAGWTGACASAGTNSVCVLGEVIEDQLATVRFTEIPALTIGYWKNHLTTGTPRTSQYLPKSLGTYEVDTTDEAAAIFKATNCGNSKDQNAIGCLAGQLLAAKLNYANDVRHCIDETITDADDFLKGIDYTGPTGKYTLTEAQRSSAVGLAKALDSYNNGNACVK